MQYGFTNYSHHAVHYIPITYLFYDWEFVPLNPFHSFCPPPTTIALKTTNTFSASIVLLCLFLCFVFQFHIEVKSYDICH